MKSLILLCNLVMIVALPCATGQVSNNAPLPGDEEVRLGYDNLNSGNQPKAAEYFRIAADKNNPMGCYELAMCYVNGKGVIYVSEKGKEAR